MRALLARLAAWLDTERTARYLRREDTPNGDTKLQAIYQALDDARDSLAGIHACVRDGHQEEALRLIEIAHDSINEHTAELRELL